MSEKDKLKTPSRSYSADWFVQGILARIGDTFDKFIGIRRNDSSNLATSKLAEKMKSLMDQELREDASGARFVPHILSLKIQWDKFSTDSSENLEALRDELTIAAIDHINDRRYHTYAPIEIDIATDYFTDGVRLFSSFGKFGAQDEEAVEVNVTFPKLKIDSAIIPETNSDKNTETISVVLNEKELIAEQKIYEARFKINGEIKVRTLDFNKSRRISIGRGVENGLVLQDRSVSKIHASLALNSDLVLVIADTGSTNGTFLNDERIPYGKTLLVENDAKVRFGDLVVELVRLRSIGSIIPSIDEESISETIAFSNDTDSDNDSIEQAESNAETPTNIDKTQDWEI